MTRRARALLSGLLALAAGLVILLVAVQLARAEAPRIEMVHGDRLIIIDGDTVHLSCAADGGPAVAERRACPERIRIYNIDAPEIGHARCAAEREMGVEARAALARLLAGQSVTIHRCEPGPHGPRCIDPYGRTLARLVTAAGDVGEAMIRRGRAMPWQPGPAAAQARASVFCGE